MWWLQEAQEQQQSPEELTKKLIEFVAEKKHSEPENIYTYTTYKVAKMLSTTLQHIIEGFEADSYDYYLLYIKRLESQIDNFADLARCAIFKRCAEFYTEEKRILDESILQTKSQLAEFNLAEKWKFVVEGYDLRVILRDQKQGQD